MCGMTEAQKETELLIFDIYRNHKKYDFDFTRILL